MSRTIVPSPSDRKPASIRGRVTAALGAALCATSFLAAAPAAATATAGPASASGPGRNATVVLGRAPRLPAGTRALGTVGATAPETGDVVLGVRDPAALTTFIAQITDKKSAMFRHYLGAGQFAARFGPAPATTAAVVADLRSAGLTASVQAGGTLVRFTGTAARVEAMFGTTIERYRLPDGSLGQATTSAVHVPAALAGAISAVVGLDDVAHAHPDGVIRPPASMKGKYPAAYAPAFRHAAGEAQACPAATTVASEFGGLTDDQIANAYGATPLYSAGDFGNGQTVAVFELEPFAPSDISTFDSCYYGANSGTVFSHLESEYTSTGSVAAQLTVDGGQPADFGSGEALLDVEDVSGLAPGATIEVYEAPNTTFGGLDEYAAIVSQDTAKVVTTSWGLCEQAVQQGEPGVQQAENILFEQAAAQGQSVFSAAGDTGSNDCNAFRTTAPVTPVLSVDDPSSQPYVVAVGGTTIDDATTPPAEHVWNDGAEWGAGGGGISESWPMPTWQLDSRVPGVDDTTTVDAANAVEQSDLGEPGYAFCLSDSGAGPYVDACRELPDVTAQADEFTGAITVYSASFGPGPFGWSTIGGTSSATPLWAAMLALVNDSGTSTACTAPGTGVGFVSPLLYSVASNPAADAASFNDITAGNNDPYGFAQLFPATTGYDMASGLGSPQLTHGGGAGLAYYLCAAAVSATRPAVTSIVPSSESTAGGVPVVVHGTGFCNGTTSLVTGVTLGTESSPGVPVDSVNCAAGTITTGALPPASHLTSPGDATDGAGTYEAVVTLTDGETSRPDAASAFEYVDQKTGVTVPAVTGVRDFAGTEAGGNTVEIFGTGFDGVNPANGVTFGSVPATSFTILSDSEIQATVPQYAPGSTVCVQDGSYFSSAENATNDICQVEVAVKNSVGSSATSTILPLYEGPIFVDQLGVIPAPAGEEASPAPTEYDYVPAPHISGISTSGGPTTLASEFGGSLVTITGSGFNPVALSFVDFGDPTLGSSVDAQLVSVTGTQIQVGSLPIASPVSGGTVDEVTVPATVQTLAGSSNAVDATYAGVPTVSSLSIKGGPDTGGTPFTLTGAGMSDVFGVEFVDATSPFSIGTQYHVSAPDDETLDTTTVAENPALLEVGACTVSGCSLPNVIIICIGPGCPPPPPPPPEIILFPPGDPKVDSISAVSGPAHGGNMVVVHGENLGCVTSVRFGTFVAEQFGNSFAILDCGSTSTVLVAAPPGPAGLAVPVRVTTVESDVTGSGPSASSATYTWAPSSPSTPQRLRVVPAGGSASLSWAAPVSNGGLPVTGYQVVASSPARAPITVTLPGNASAYAFGFLQPGVKWIFTVTAVSHLGSGLPARAGPYVLAPGDNGYLVTTADGALFGFGSLAAAGGVGGMRLASPVVGVAATPSALGYYLAAADGTVYRFGNAIAPGSASLSPGARVVGIAATADGAGFWLVTDTGAVYAFGDAHYTGGARGVSDVVGIAPTKDGHGYYLAEADGKVLNFGDAAPRGDLLGHPLNAPIVGISLDPATGGFWLVGGDGGVFSFGARFFGSMIGVHLNEGAVGMVGTPDGLGYWLVAGDGGVFSFGSARYAGNPLGRTESAAVGIAD